MLTPTNGFCRKLPRLFQKTGRHIFCCFFCPIDWLPHVSNIFFFCFAYSQFWMPYHDAFYRSISEPGWLTYLVIGITNKLHHPNNENSSPLHEEHALNAQSVARLVAQVFHFLHSCATICGRAAVTLGRASLIIWRKATHFVESCH